MASRRELRRRIRSITNTAQITKAMQMVAASRMRKAQQRVAASRPYSDHITAIVADVMSRPGAAQHPLLARREIRTAEIVLVSPDRGLAGGLIANILRETGRLVQELNVPVRVVAVGKKGRDFVVRTRMELVAEYTGLGDNVTILDVGPIAEQVVEDFESERADVAYLVYSEFVNTLRQEPRSVQMLPVLPPERPTVTAPWSYEPDNPEAVLSDLLPRYLEFSIYHAILENQASYHSAQMVAMKNATDNAQDLIGELTLQMNKARQAEITKEVAEISGAAEAIRAG